MMGRSSLIISLHYLSARTRKVSTPTPKIEPVEVPKIEEDILSVSVIDPLLSLPTVTATLPLRFGINTESLTEILRLTETDPNLTFRNPDATFAARTPKRRSRASGTLPLPRPTPEPST